MKKKIIFVLILITQIRLFSVPVFGQQSTRNSSAANHVLKLTIEYSEAIARRDASVHERLFAHDYTYTHGGGNIMGREEHMNFTKNGGVVVDSLRNGDMSVRMYGKTAVVTGLWVVTLRSAGNEPAKRNLRYILVYVKRAGRWQIVAEQRTGSGQPQRLGI